MSSNSRYEVIKLNEIDQANFLTTLGKYIPDNLQETNVVEFLVDKIENGRCLKIVVDAFKHEERKLVRFVKDCARAELARDLVERKFEYELGTKDRYALLQNGPCMGRKIIGDGRFQQK